MVCFVICVIKETEGYLFFSYDVDVDVSCR